MALSAKLDQVLRPDGTVARVGGDEFAILCEDVADERIVMDIAERTLAAIQEPMEIGDGQIRQVVSPPRWGWPAAVPTAAMRRVCSPTPSSPCDGRRNKAGPAVSSSRQRCEPTPCSASRMKWPCDGPSRNASSASSTQPIMALNTNKIVGAEALMRWEHPERGVVAPLDFIPLAEETGLIVPIGAWVLEVAARQAATWSSSFPARLPLRVSVNVSAAQFRAGLVDTVRSVLDRTGIDPGMRSAWRSPRASSWTTSRNPSQHWLP